MTAPAMKAAQRLQEHVLANGPADFIADALVVFRSIDVEQAARAIDPQAFAAATDLTDFKHRAARRAQATAAARAMRDHLTREQA